MPKHFVAMPAVVLAACLIWVPACAQADRNPLPGSVPTRLAEAQANPKLADTLLRTGRKVAAVCANCHGEGGNSVRPEVPNLAGQNTAYLVEQMRQFGDGLRRNEFMQGMIRAMSTDEKVGMALFYSQQTVRPGPGAEASLLAQGEMLFQKICFRCQGNDGHGNEKIARIAGQQGAYLSATLRRYRTGSGDRVNEQMADNTRLLSDANLDAIVAYVASMK
jgi:cytochrome c553